MLFCNILSSFCGKRNLHSFVFLIVLDILIDRDIGSITYNLSLSEEEEEEEGLACLFKGDVVKCLEVFELSASALNNSKRRC